MSNRNSFVAPITYFLNEGKENLYACLELSFEAAVRHDITKLVIFTGMGEGVKIALQEFKSRPEYNGIDLIAVGFPQGRQLEPIADETLELLRSDNIPFIRTHLPFDPVHGTYRERGTGQGLSLLGSVLEIFCGSMNLCVQAALIACDSHAIEDGEHVIALTSDTSILVRACPTCDFLTNFIVREILCKPAMLTISKNETTQEALTEGETITMPTKKLESGQ